MHNVQFEISKPTGDGEFEDMCARIYGTVFNDPLPQTNGRRGQKQGGIDVFIDAPEGRLGVQCKRYADGALKLKHVEHEVSEADRANTPIIRLIVATTATSDAVLLRDVQDLSDARVANGQYPVKIEFWQDLCRHIRGSSKLQNDYAPNAPGAVFHRLDEQNAGIEANLLSISSKLQVLAGLPSGRADSVNKYLTSQLDAVNDVLRAARFKDALEDLQRIGADMALFDAHQKARWYVQRGVCTWHLASSDAAAPDFLRAAELYPDDEKIAAAMVRGLLFTDKVDEALAAGDEALARFPVSVHVWIAHANARMVKGHTLALADAPAAMRDDCDVLQLLAWARKKIGDIVGAVELSAKALAKPNAGFFVRNTALVLALEAAASDPVKVAHGLVSEAAIAALRQAVDALTPRKDRVWSVQSPGAVEDTLVHIGYSYLVLGAPEETLALVEEARHADVLTPHLKRVALEAYRRLDRPDELVQLGREWLNDLEEEALILVAEYASGVGDVQLVETVQALVVKKGFQQEEVPHLLLAMRWVALWRSDTGKQQALTEVKAADVASSDSLAVICGGARILHAAKDEAAADAAIQKACILVLKDTASAERLLLADLLFATDKLELAARQYELLTPRGKHSELHNRLLRCYVRTGALRKAKELVFSFPDSWTSDERALSLAIDLGQQASDWEFLVPLAELHCERRRQDAGGWLLRLALDLKMRKMARFHRALESVPAELSGPPRLLAQVASLELRFGRKETGMRRLYGMFRRNLDDVDAASAYFIAIVAGPQDLPFMEENLTEVQPGSAVTLKNELGETVTLSLDPEGFPDLPAREGMVAPSSDMARSLLGVALGQQVSLPGPFGTEQRFVVERVTSTFRRLLRTAQDRVNSPLASELLVMSVPVPKTDKGADFSHVHAMLKRQSEHSRRALQGYADSPITLGILGKLLGRSVVDMVAGWPSDAPPLFVCAGTKEQREAAVELLQRADAEYVVDAATVAELASLDCLAALAALPRVYISTKAVETLEARLEEAKHERSGGHMFDDNGTMRFVEYTIKDRERHTAFIQSMVEAVRQHCVMVPAYGPEELPADLERAQDVLEDEELAALLLTAEKSATLFTVDGRLAQFGFVSAKLKSVWPQEVLRYAGERGKLTHQQYAFAVVRMFLRNRSFVSLGAYDLVFMCLQGGYALAAGLQRFKDYLVSSSTELVSAVSVAFDFLELQAQHPTQFNAFAELLEHIVEASLRHPHCNQEALLKVALDFASEIARKYNGPLVPFAPVEDHRQKRMRVYAKVLGEAVEAAVRHASSPPRRRAIKLRTLKCMQPPYLTFDGEAKDPGEPPIQNVKPLQVEDIEAGSGKTTLGSS
jgi:tetratricopeptide (TPR) repeat protein